MTENEQKDIEVTPTADESVDAEPTAETPPAPEAVNEDGDKFIQFTRKVTAGVEKAVSSSYTKAREAVKDSEHQPLSTIRLLDRLLDWARHVFPAERYDSLCNWCARYGHFGLLTAQVLALLFGFVAAIALRNWVLLFHGIGLAVLLWFLQYTAYKFLDAGDHLIRASPSRLGSAAFLDCAALISEIAGILAFIACLLAIHRAGQWSMIWVGIGLWALFDAIAFIALNPEMINIEVSDDVAAGEEAIGILSFLVKAVVRIVPIAYGVGAIIGTVGLLCGTISLIFTGNADAGYSSIWLIALCTLLPFASYVLFAFYHLAIDILRAVLVIPGKLDALDEE